MDYLMGIDLGSTSLKAVVYDLDGRAVSAGSRPTEKFHPSAEHPEWIVWQPEQIWGGTAAAIREALARLDDPRQVRGVAVTGMGMDGLPIDDRGAWLYPMISWHDPRTGPQHAWWLEHVGAERTFSIGGNPVWPINSALRILWMMEHEPGIMARADKWLLIEDFVNLQLSGRRATDYSMASCTMLFDQRRLDWSDELLRLSGIDRRLLCDPHPSGTPLGEVTAEAARLTGLAPGTPVILGGHDHLCGTLPVGAFRPGVALNIAGTWETVLAASETSVGWVERSEPHRGVTDLLKDDLRRSGITVQAHVARAKHAVWGGNVAGEMLEWYRRQYGSSAAHGAAGGRGAAADAGAETAGDWDALMASAASASPGAHGVTFLPHMSGSSCPVVDPRSLGALVGLSGAATAADIVRAVIEGLCYQLLEVLMAMQSALGTRLERIVGVGGGTRNAFWMQTKATVAGRPIEVPDVEEATPLGAAILAGIGLGLYRDEEEACARVYRPGRTYEPDPALAPRYAEWFTLYKNLYPALAPLSHGLFELL